MRRRKQLIVDIAIILILIIFAVNGARRGLLRSLAGLIIFLLSLVLSFLLVRPGSSWLVEQGLFSGYAGELSAKIEAMAGPGNSLLNVVLEKLHLPSVWLRHISSSIGAQESNLATAIALSLIKIAVSALLFWFLFLSISFLLKLAARELTKLLNNIYLVGSLNKLGGIVIKLFYGLVIVFLLIFLLTALTPLYPRFGLWLESSSIANFLREKNYFADLLESVF